MFAYNDFERIFSLTIMILGGMLMTYSISVLGQIMVSMDNSNVAFGERLEILNRIHREYYLPFDLYLKIKKSMQYKYDKDIQDLNKFIDELPPNLRGETAGYIHEDTWKTVDYFKNQDKPFIAWICPQLRPMFCPAETEIYHENHKVERIYFLLNGDAGFVLSASLRSFKYIDVNHGCHFGIIDVIGSLLDLEKTADLKYCFNNWNNYVDRLHRQFTVSTISGAEMLTLPIEEVWNLRTEFIQEYDDFMHDAFGRLDQCHRLKLKAMNFARHWLGKQYRQLGKSS